MDATRDLEIYQWKRGNGGRVCRKGGSPSHPGANEGFACSPNYTGNRIAIQLICIECKIRHRETQMVVGSPADGSFALDGSHKLNLFSSKSHSSKLFQGTPFISYRSAGSPRGGLLCFEGEDSSHCYPLIEGMKGMGWASKWTTEHDPCHPCECVMDVRIGCGGERV